MVVIVTMVVVVVDGNAAMVVVAMVVVVDVLTIGIVDHAGKRRAVARGQTNRNRNFVKDHRVIYNLTF